MRTHAHTRARTHSFKEHAGAGPACSQRCFSFAAAGVTRKPIQGSKGSHRPGGHLLQQLPAGWGPGEEPGSTQPLEPEAEGRFRSQSSLNRGASVGHHENPGTTDSARGSSPRAVPASLYLILATTKGAASTPDAGLDSACLSLFPV